MEISEEFIMDLFKKIDFPIRKKNSFFYVKVPAWRNDIKEDVDLIEEIARYTGYSEVPSELPVVNVEPTPDEIEYIKVEKIRDMMKNLGFNEVVNSSLISETTLKLSGLRGVPLLNPLSKNFAYLRPSLILSLLETAEFNFSKQIKNLRIFEIGKVYTEENGEYSEEGHLLDHLTLK